MVMEEEKKRTKSSSWLHSLLSTNFFGSCSKHHGIKKKIEVNIYCVDCRSPMCSLCVSSISCQHQYHRLLQIRRYIYQNVIRLRDMQKLIDCAKVQSYTVNGAKVVLLNPRIQSRPTKFVITGATFCKFCRRTVAEHSGYCSIFCKVSKEAARPSDPDAFVVSDGGSASSVVEELETSHEGRAYSLLSLQPSNSRWMEGALPHSRWIEGDVPHSGKPKVVRRKGIPRRSPIS
ncbi:hypothetical protein KSP39_PZI016765 [Platanthera zijinensis]|uniref:B box-type domain-containing protein n=1 Tax=Platanthera zijinensis TaxID=2320716 RepID=A0AAP0B798_9ASPA